MNTFTSKRCLSALIILVILAVSLGRPSLPARAVVSWPTDPPLTATTRVSVAFGGGDSNNDSYFPAISADGRYVAFASPATNLVDGGTDGTWNIYRRDMATGTTILVSVGIGGPANGDSDDPSISGDGNLVAFHSAASNLIPASFDDNGQPDIFVRNMTTGSTTMVSVAYDGQPSHVGWSEAPAISSDGNFVAFISSAYNLLFPFTSETVVHVYLRDLDGGTTLVSTGASGAGNDSSYDPFFGPAISSDGHYVAFESNATNLTTDVTNGVTNIFLRDTVGHTTKLVSKGLDGLPTDLASSSPAISADGRYIAFKSASSDLVAGDTNSVEDIFVRDTGVEPNTTTRVSVGENGEQANLNSSYLSISGNGRYVAFRSTASNLMAGDTNGVSDIFIRDTSAGGTTTRVSVTSSGVEANRPSGVPAISSDGRYLAFESLADNLFVGDANNYYDIYFVPGSGEVPGTPEHPDAQVRLSVSVGGTGPGSVTSAPAGISCGTSCVYWFDSGAEVTLTAHLGDSVIRFLGWGGDCSGTELTCGPITMSSAKTVSAEFLEYRIHLPFIQR